MANSSRQSRLSDLQKAVTDYSTKETTRLQNEVSILNEVIKGRGASLSSVAVQYVAGVAQNDLSDYLSEA